MQSNTDQSNNRWERETGHIVLSFCLTGILIVYVAISNFRMEWLTANGIALSIRQRNFEFYLD